MNMRREMRIERKKKMREREKCKSVTVLFCEVFLLTEIVFGFIDTYNGLVCCTKTCRQAHWTRLAPLQVKFLVNEGRHRIDSLISGQHEELYTENGKEAHIFLISRSMKQVLKSPNKSTMINDLIKKKKNSKKTQQEVDYFLVPHRDSQNHVHGTATWNDMKFQRSKIVFNAKYTVKPFSLILCKCLGAMMSVHS